VVHTVQTAPCDKVARKPLWVFVGEDDDVVPHWMARNAALYINRTCSPAEQARVTEYPGAGHNVWDLTYDLTGMKPGLTSPDFDSYSPDIYSWLLQHERNPSRGSGKKLGRSQLDWLSGLGGLVGGEHQLEAS
jgi:predicted peptidase